MKYIDELDTYITDHVRKRIQVLREINPNKLYTTTELCGDFWDSFDESDHKIIGKRVKVLSKGKWLELVVVGRTPCNKQLYRITIH
jgi:hypothetical protein